MFKFKQITKSVNVVDKIVCNRCGKIIKQSNEELGEGTILNASFGFGSRKDGVFECFHLCDNCYDEFISDFKLRPSNQLDILKCET